MKHFRVAVRSGFTVVELLVVIVVIAILAVITVVVFNGVQSRAIEASVQSDLSNIAKTLESDLVVNGMYPELIANANDGKGIKLSGDNQSNYLRTPNGYCFSVSNSRTNKVFSVRSPGSVVEERSCEVTVSTIAGSATSGTSDGTPGQFASARSVAMDSAGNTYVGDGNRIRKISPQGVVSTLAGTTTSGHANGTGTGALFSFVRGIAVAPNGDIYVADSGNERIRKVTAAGVVTDFSGTGVRGWVEGSPTVARYSYPTDVALDSDGNVYVADYGNNRIRKISSTTGVSVTLAGFGVAGYAEGAPTVARFNKPLSVKVDRSGFVYVADLSNHRIRKITPEGTVSTLAGTGVQGYLDGDSTVARFNEPRGIAIDNSGVVYVVDARNDRVRQISPSGTVTTLAGGARGFAEGTGAAARFSDPYSIILGPSNDLYVADQGNYRIRKVQL